MAGKALAAASGKPFLAINHLEAHALTVRLTSDAPFPYFLLLVSGGHCQMLIVYGVGSYTRIGTTRDDALGEAFDKCAKLLGLPYPGGPAIERAAKQGNAQRYALPKPMFGAEHADFSFSGLKTAVRLLAIEESQKPEGLSASVVADIAASFQRTVVELLIERVGVGLKKAAAARPTALAIAGGVAANESIRAGLTELAGAHGLKLLVAPPALCTDNAAMVAWAGMERLMLGQRDGLDTEPKARWPLAS